MTKKLFDVMIDLYEIFSGLLPPKEEDKYFSIEEFSSSLPHKLGCSKEMYPCFFVECSDDVIATNINLKQFSVNFNQVCNLQDNTGQTSTKKYSIILLKSHDIDIQKYFLDLVYIVLCKLPTKPTIKKLKQEIAKIISLFSASSSVSKEVIQGLWAELFVIANSRNPDYLIKSWHVSTDDKYDFNDGKDKIEVKATKKQDRVHSFSIEQLNPNKDSILVVASIIVAQSGIGSSIFDLVDGISNQITDTESLLMLKEKVYLTIGPHLEDVRKVKYDVSMAKNTYKLYYHHVIPTIPIETVPSEVTNIHFSVCLKDLATADLSFTQSKLHQSL